MILLLIVLNFLWSRAVQAFLSRLAAAEPRAPTSAGKARGRAKTRRRPWLWEQHEISIYGAATPKATRQRRFLGLGGRRFSFIFTSNTQNKRIMCKKHKYVETEMFLPFYGYCKTGQCSKCGALDPDNVPEPLDDGRTPINPFAYIALITVLCSALIALAIWIL